MDQVSYLLVLLIGLLFAVAAVTGLARRFAISYPIALVSFGLLCSLIPHVPNIPLAPAIVQTKEAPSDHPAATPTGAVGTAYPTIVDITESTRIKFDHLSSPEQKYIVESMSGGVALIDYDRDGWTDIYFTNAQNVEMARSGRKARSALYRNNHDGTFTDVTDRAGVGYPCWAQGVTVGDYDNDGWPDMLVTCFGGVVLYRNNGDGTFTDRTRTAGLSADTGWATGAAFGDYDGDGREDLFVSHYVDLHLNNLAAFGSKDTCRYLGIDVQCGPRGLKGAPDTLYHNNGNGTFTDVSTRAGVADEDRRYGLTPLWADFDEDGKLDLLVANDASANYLYRGDGKGNFSDAGFTSGVAYNENGVAQANMGIAVGDYLHTGRLSILLTHFDSEYAALYRNDGKMSFTDVSASSGVLKSTRGYVQWGTGFVDFSNSGWPDVFIVSGHVYPQVDSIPGGPRYREPKVLLLNQRNGTFKDLSKEVGPAIQIPQVSRGMAVGELFNDGKMEVVVENLVGLPMILRPERGAQNHWISFQLEGTKRDRMALNARVRASAGELVQVAELFSGGSYLSQNELRIHFGLGRHDRLSRAEVMWPDGEIEVLKNLAADRHYLVRENVGVVSSTPAASQSLPRRE
jgi:enediyne biosynthesis protein E4